MEIVIEVQIKNRNPSTKVTHNYNSSVENVPIKFLDSVAW